MVQTFTRRRSVCEAGPLSGPTPRQIPPQVRETVSLIQWIANHGED
jgi:hypothetical protein